jgi:hypothetical protein
MKTNIALEIVLIFESKRKCLHLLLRNSRQKTWQESRKAVNKSILTGKRKLSICMRARNPEIFQSF